MAMKWHSCITETSRPEYASVRRQARVRIIETSGPNRYAVVCATHVAAILVIIVGMWYVEYGAFGEDADASCKRVSPL